MWKLPCRSLYVVQALLIDKVNKGKNFSGRVDQTISDI